MPTIPETSTPQEVFDFVTEHLLTQGKQSYQGSCLYRGPNRTACAVGCLLTDEEYTPNMEGVSAYDLQVHLLSSFWKEHQRLLQDLQSAHDDKANVEPGPERKFNREKLVKQLAYVSNYHNLTFKEPEHATTH